VTTRGAADPLRSWLVARGIVPDANGQRVLAAASFVNMVGSSVFMVSAALFFTRYVGFSVTQVGLGMGIAAVVGLFAGIPIGHIADRRGPREVYIRTLAAQGAAMAAVVFVHRFWLFVAVLCVSELSASASIAARGPIVRGLGGPSPAKFRAYLHSVANLAGGLGAIAAGVAIQVDTGTAYLALVLGNALSFVACAAIVTRLPSLSPVQAPAQRNRWVALRDARYVAVTMLDAIMSMQGIVLIFALPLWIVDRTNAPRWFVGASVLVNTGMVVAIQVRASRGVDTNRAAARAIRRAGFALFVGLALIAATGTATGNLPGSLAVLVLTIGVGVFTVGELWHAAGSFELRYSLAPAHAQGQYTGIYGLGTGLVRAVAPTLLALLLITWGEPGWLVLGAVFVAVGLAMPFVVRWAEQTRPEGMDPSRGADS